MAKNMHGAWTLAIACCMALGATAGGCASSNDATTRRRRPLPMQAFVAPQGAPGAQSERRPGQESVSLGPPASGERDTARGEDAPAVVSAVGEEHAPIQARNDVAVEAYAGPPEGLDPASPANASPVLIDELVGEINGRPIFANEFLRPLEARLRQLPEDIERETGDPATPEAWLANARAIIRGEINRIIEDELFIAESYRELTVPEAGLRRFLEALRSNEISLLGGSEAAAERTIRREHGVTTDQLLETKRDELVLHSYIGQLAAGISVSMRDIKRAYRRRYDEFNPAPTVTFRWIRVDAADTGAIERITRLVEEGRFDEAGHDEANTFRAEAGGVRETEFTGELASARLLQDDVLNAALTHLAPGAGTGPIVHEGSVSWLRIESVRRVSQSLYDAQVTILRDLQDQALGERYAMKLRRLRDRAGITDEQVDSLTERLLRIAHARYAGAL